MKHRKSWIDSEFRRAKERGMLVRALQNIVDMPTDGQSDAHQLSIPEEFPANEEESNPDGAGETSHHMPRQADGSPVSVDDIINKIIPQYRQILLDKAKIYQASIPTKEELDIDNINEPMPRQATASDGWMVSPSGEIRRVGYGGHGEFMRKLRRHQNSPEDWMRLSLTNNGYGGILGIETQDITDSQFKMLQGTILKLGIKVRKIMWSTDNDLLALSYEEFLSTNSIAKARQLSKIATGSGGWWIYPGQQPINVGFEGHGTYVISNPKIFGLEEYFQSGTWNPQDENDRESATREAVRGGWIRLSLYGDMLNILIEGNISQSLGQLQNIVSGLGVQPKEYFIESRSYRQTAHLDNEEFWGKQLPARYTRAAEIGQGLSQLTTERETGKTRQTLTEPSRWNESYHNDNRFEDADLKLGESEPDDVDPLSDSIYPPYTDGIGQPNPRYEDASPKQRTITLHASESEEKESPNKAPRQFWVAVDLDGTILEPPPEGIYQDQSGRHLFGEPIEGAKEAIQELIDGGAKVSIYTARQYFAQGDAQEHDLKEAVENELIANDIPFTEVYIGKKPPAHKIIDDRAVRFQNNWDEIISELRNDLIRTANRNNVDIYIIGHKHA